MHSVPSLAKAIPALHPLPFQFESALSNHNQSCQIQPLALIGRELFMAIRKFEIFSPIKGGDTFSCSSTIESYRVAAGNEIVTVRSDLKGRIKYCALFMVDSGCARMIEIGAATS
jgi:hypothetical protein